MAMKHAPETNRFSREVFSYKSSEAADVPALSSWHWRGWLCSLTQTMWDTSLSQCMVQICQHRRNLGTGMRSTQCVGGSLMARDLLTATNKITGEFFSAGYSLLCRHILKMDNVKIHPPFPIQFWMPEFQVGTACSDNPSHGNSVMYLICCLFVPLHWMPNVNVVSWGMSKAPWPTFLSSCYDWSCYQIQQRSSILHALAAIHIIPKWRCHIFI